MPITTATATVQPAPAGFHHADPKYFPDMIASDLSVRPTLLDGGELDGGVNLFVSYPGTAEEVACFFVGHAEFNAEEALRVADTLHALVELNRARLAG